MIATGRGGIKVVVNNKLKESTALKKYSHIKNLLNFYYVFGCLRALLHGDELQKTTKRGADL